MDGMVVRHLLAAGEGLSVVFARRVSAAYINERRVIETMACLANAEGGTLLVGVDRDGTVSGCHPFHGDRTDPALLASVVYRYTSPGLPVEVAVVDIDGREVVAITVAAQPTPVGTTWGVYRTRRLNSQGIAECVGMEPAYLFTRYRDAHGVDWALTPAAGPSADDLDPEAIDAYRQLCTDPRLRNLDDASLVRTLGFLDDSAEPVALGAIALFGTADAVRRHLPYHQVVVADRREAPRTWRSSAPLALMLGELHRNAELFGAAFPLVINALLHRDYFLPGPVHVALDQDGARVASPGAAPRGVDLGAAAAGASTYAPRSLYLTTAIAHTSLTQGAGAGLPGTAVRFDGSHEHGVVASLPWGNASLPPAEPHADLSENETKALEALRTAETELASSDVAKAAGLSTQQAYRALRKLVDAGIVTRTGETRTTRYSV
ncbi:putative DNA binding domain-containing protein [Corynebacterium sp. TA-R-1]|uniref:DNA binding domain-containing protein n=1 Tax=Corynebacterium stercoris TaxID=2943490 RepID=A0ABT1G361_9CORY|nr:RNA-binding domain-containing protein [Corynebacterium stercoris]MCP1388465.1 putative DNA binding domain-containing protein [Corynebacterium stercoris]